MTESTPPEAGGQRPEACPARSPIRDRACTLRPDEHKPPDVHLIRGKNDTIVALWRESDDFVVGGEVWD